MMPYAEFVRGLAFHTLRPEQSAVGWVKTGEDRIASELADLIVPTAEAAIKERLAAINGVTRMSSSAFGALINYGVSCIPDDSCYLNVGIWCGYSFLAGMVGNPSKRCIGVDNFSLFAPGAKRESIHALLAGACNTWSPTSCVYEQDYAEYLTTTHTQPIGLYFYDGNHDYAHQLRGLQLAEPFFTDDAIVLVDDTNWPGPRQATLDFLAASPHTYRMLLDQRTYKDRTHPTHAAIGSTHPTFWNGIMLFQRG